MTHLTHLTHSIHLAAAMTAAVLVVAACTGGAPVTTPAGNGGPASGRPAQSPPTLISPLPSGVSVTGEVPRRIVDAARELLAGDVGADAAASATILVGEAVTWPDGSLGCPEPGVMYTQQLVPGYHLVFDVAGTTYDFRATEGGTLRACDLLGPRSTP